jgi:hypothetical protein
MEFKDCEDYINYSFKDNILTYYVQKGLHLLVLNKAGTHFIIH